MKKKDQILLEQAYDQVTGGSSNDKLKSAFLNLKAFYQWEQFGDDQLATSDVAELFRDMDEDGSLDPIINGDLDLVPKIFSTFEEAKKYVLHYGKSVKDSRGEILFYESDLEEVERGLNALSKIPGEGYLVFCMNFDEHDICVGVF